MSPSTPHHHNPERPGTARPDPALIDLVPGNPPVPISVWRTARTDADTGRVIPARLAARLIAAYTRPGEVVVDLTTDHSLAAACRTGRRRHHPARFTSAGGLRIDPATPPSTPGGDPEVDDPDPSIWLVDDLTGTELPDRAPATGSQRGAVSLVVATWPLHGTEATHRVRLARLLSGCADLLRPGACLMLVVDARPDATAPPDFGPVMAAAAQVGLGYLQHIVAVVADTDGDVFVYYLGDQDLHALAHGTAAGQNMTTHLRVHADLLVLTRDSSSATASGRGLRRAGGGRRD